MKQSFSIEAKVGLFVAVALAIIAYITVQVSDLSLSPGGYYTVYTLMVNAEGITPKTPIQVAGIPVGVVSSIKLLDNKQALIGLKIKKEVQLTEDASIQVRSRGVLGDKYIEIMPGNPNGPPLKPGQQISNVKPTADYQNLYGDVDKLTNNLVSISEALKEYTVSDKSHTAQILQNMETMTANMANFSNANMNNMDAIVQNLRALTQDLRSMTKNSSGDVEVAISRISELTDKINRGEGTVGRLLNDPSTVEKANEVLDNLSEVTRSYTTMETELGYHLEYLGGESAVKNYVELKLQPRPDKFFLFQVVYDPNPPSSTSTGVTTISAGGQQSTITTTNESFDKVRFSAELGKKFGDFTLRGGLIESTGGVGVDYDRGPFGIHLSVFDFTSSRPQVKAIGTMNITPSIYVLGGVDDLASSTHDLNWVMGGGLRLTDADLKSLIGGAAGILSR